MTHLAPAATTPASTGAASPASPPVLPDSPPATAVILSAVPTRRQLTVTLGDLDIAPENLRFDEEPDDDIPELAATIRAAGLLQFPTTRPGRRKEAAFMVLDGRRRLLALRLLREAGDIDDDYPVEIFEETDKARQAAAVVLTNTAVPVHVADVIAAIGRMLKARLGVTVIAQALGYAELEIKRLAALSALPPVALQALKAGRVTLRQARLLARLNDPETQAELAQTALDGQGFQDWRVNERLDDSRVTTRDARCTLVGAEAYAAAGGRTETDLFGELPPVLLDPEILTEVWLERAREIALILEAEGLEVHVTAGPAPTLPEDLEALGYVYGGDLSAEAMANYREARERYYEAVEVVESAEIAEDPAGILIPMIRAKIAQDQAGVGSRVVTVLVMSPSLRAGVEVRCYSPEEPEIAPEPGDDVSVPDRAASPPAYVAPVVETAAPETEGVNHTLHATRTDVATRGLIRALADDPGAALTALIAGLFNALAIRSGLGRQDAALAITASRFQPTGARVIDTLDGEVRHRLDLRRADWEASGLTVIAWIHGLAHGDKMGLLAELTAITLHWTPDADFLQPHSKPRLLAMLTEMGAEDERALALRKAELVGWVAEQAASRVWAPAALSWRVEDGDRDPDPEDGTEGDVDDLAQDGVGAFAITPEGEGALEHAAA